MIRLEFKFKVTANKNNPARKAGEAAKTRSGYNQSSCLYDKFQYFSFHFTIILINYT